MTSQVSLPDLQVSVQDRAAFGQLEDYYALAHDFLSFLEEAQLTRIVSPNDHRYVFYQYDREFGHRITRPLNSDLFIDRADDFRAAVESFMSFLGDLRRLGAEMAHQASVQTYLMTGEVNKVVYTCQQIVGSIGDSLENSNQSRKRIGQLFENLVRLLLVEIGFTCSNRTISIPIPDSPDYSMSYELDLVFSKKGAILASESALIHPGEVVGSVKTTSKDRVDKVFLDKFLLNRLLGREIKMIAIFLHDVQRARRANSIFGVNSTFKTNHFLGYTVALNRLDGVYYVDPRPEMRTDPRLRQEIDDFQAFLTRDVWQL
ncbi:MAG: hypothetical protein KDD72_12530 [Anaerolineales bacterium]|nr:hypothetical protein [Anaerolineales bacterium]